MVNLNIHVTGKVQGVFFRASAREKATQLGVMGTARNLPDGSVFIEAEGDPEKIEELIKWCHTGPEMAKVQSVETTKGTVKGFSDFKIVR